MIKVSVIVPVYNSETYLHTCIQSLQNQKLKEIEIILVNDGSTDRSKEICKSYAVMDKRIFFIDQAHRGVSAARNAGIAAAQGEWIGFLDSDDWVEPEMYFNLYELARKNQADLCLCNYIEEKDRKKIVHKINFTMRNECLFGEGGEELIGLMLGSPSSNGVVMGSVCRLLIHKEFILAHQLFFYEKIKYMEDLLYCIEALLSCTRICIDNNAYYHYIRHKGSTMSSYKNDYQQIAFLVYDIIERNLKKKNKLSLFQQNLCIRYLSTLMGIIANELQMCQLKNLRKNICFIKTLYDNKLQEVLYKINSKQITFRKKIPVLLFQYQCSFGIWLYFKMNRLLKKNTY